MGKAMEVNIGAAIFFAAGFYLLLVGSKVGLALLLFSDGLDLLGFL